MFHRPVCAKCKEELRVKKNGVLLVDYDSSGMPLHLWNADLYECDVCDTSIVSGFGENPVVSWNDRGGTREGFEFELKKVTMKAREHGLPVIENHR